MINVNLFHWKHDISKASEQVRQNVFVTGLVPRALIIEYYCRFWKKRQSFNLNLGIVYLFYILLFEF